MLIRWLHQKTADLGLDCFLERIYLDSRGQNRVSVHYLLNQGMDFDQTYIDTLLGGGEELIRSWWPWHNFLKVTLALWNVQNRVSMRYILNQLMDFDQTCIESLLESWEEFIRFWWPWHSFQCHPISTHYLPNQWYNINQTCIDIFFGYIQVHTSTFKFGPK